MPEAETSSVAACQADATATATLPAFPLDSEHCLPPAPERCSTTRTPDQEGPERRRYPGPEERWTDIRGFNHPYPSSFSQRAIHGIFTCIKIRRDSLPGGAGKINPAGPSKFAISAFNPSNVKVTAKTKRVASQRLNTLATKYHFPFLEPLK